MILRITVDNFPTMNAPDIPTEKDKPYRSTVFCINAEMLGNPDSPEMLCQSFLSLTSVTPRL